LERRPVRMRLSLGLSSESLVLSRSDWGVSGFLSVWQPGNNSITSINNTVNCESRVDLIIDLLMPFSWYSLIFLRLFNSGKNWHKKTKGCPQNPFPDLGQPPGTPASPPKTFYILIRLT
ncbi:MAG TPA: hypothetical protein DER33_03260, partial [Syntrophomonas sp.]|nr:hypothetical protein [Syntrophomonas sp.]